MRFSAVALLFAGAALAGTESAESTVYSTEYLTVTSCAPEVTNCPARTHTKVYPLTTSTVYSTTVHTVTSCAPEVTNCPAHSTVYSTEVVAAYTTVCPVASTGKSYYNTTIGTGPGPVGTGGFTYTAPAKGGKTASGSSPVAVTSVPAACPTYSVKTISTSVTTVVPTVIYETVAIPCPTAPAAGTGTAVGTGSVVVPSSVVTAGAGNIAFPGALAAAAGLLAVLLA